MAIPTKVWDIEITATREIWEGRTKEYMEEGLTEALKKMGCKDVLVIAKERTDVRTDS